MSVILRVGGGLFGVYLGFHIMLWSRHRWHDRSEYGAIGRHTKRPILSMVTGLSLTAMAAGLVLSVWDMPGKSSLWFGGTVAGALLLLIHQNYRRYYERETAKRGWVYPSPLPASLVEKSVSDACALVRRAGGDAPWLAAYVRGMGGEFVTDTVSQTQLWTLVAVLDKAVAENCPEERKVWEEAKELLKGWHLLE